MTTVGYGDIVCGSFNEIIFQIILLSAGIIVYTFIVSSIGNYVKNESHASMKFDKDEGILEEIRISYPNMPFKLYNQIFHHLAARKIRQQHCDSNILINSLPYSLKNKILLTIYRQTINNFKIFRGHQNTDFTLRLLTNFIPLFSKKNAFLIHEGQIIDNIIFVKEGRLGLEASINIDEPGKSVLKYLNKNFIDINEDIIIVSNYDTSFSPSKYTKKNYKKYIKKAKNEIDTVINHKSKINIYSSINESKIEKELGKWEFGGEVFEEINYQFINIINISKNESYGSVYMFLSKPSPLSLRVKSKKAELLLLRKNDASDISKRYPNIWAKFFKKSYLNMLSIKSNPIHKINHYWKNLGKELFQNKELFQKQISTKEKVEFIDDKKKKDNKENEHLNYNKNNVITVKECNNINNNKKDIALSNAINSNKNLLSIQMTQASFKNSSKNLAYINNDKYISFGQSSNSINRISFQNNEKKDINTIGKKNRPKKTFSTQCAGIMNNNNTLMKLSSVYQSKFKSSVLSKKKLSTQIKKRSIQNLRINYLKKLKKKN